MKKNRTDVVSDLTQYYKEKGIVPNNFTCKKCNLSKENFKQGAQCHIGNNYGNGVMRTLVVSLDCGGKSVVDDIDKVTAAVEGWTQAKNPQNIHRIRTNSMVADLLGIKVADDNGKYYATTNACKCCRSKSMNQMNEKYFKNCAEYKLEEIVKLDPDVVYFQGNRARIGVTFKKVETCPKELSDYIRHLTINDKKYWSVICIHPSARGSHSERAKEFYTNIIPKINAYIRSVQN